MRLSDTKMSPISFWDSDSRKNNLFLPVIRYRRWGTRPGIRERRISSEMNVSDLMINLCESQLTTLKNKKVVAFQKYTADREKKAKLEQIYT